MHDIFDNLKKVKIVQKPDYKWDRGKRKRKNLPYERIPGQYLLYLVYTEIQIHIYYIYYTPSN